jgi:outer membrane protein OmpA-like peptidoglycan-associated protein
MIALLAVTFTASAQQKDDPKCKDHPLFTRMPDSWIHNCTEKEFDSFQFLVGEGKKIAVEGRLWKLSYYPQATAQSKPSELQILRNFENAAKKVGGTVVFATKNRETLKILKDGKEIWVDVTAEFTGKYGLVIVQREAMTQDVTANAAFFADGLKAAGHVVVDGIFFDTGKSDLKPESDAALAEIAALLTEDPSLKLYVVGHTDNVGGLESNLKLSQDRAAAVVAALTAKHGIAAARLRPFGAGPHCPVASNDQEQGRAQNRRVELVKQ